MPDSLGHVFYAAEGSLFSEMLTGRRVGAEVFFLGGGGYWRLSQTSGTTDMLSVASINSFMFLYKVTIQAFAYSHASFV